MLLLALAIQASAFTYKEGRSTLGPYPTDRVVRTFPDSLTPVFVNHVSRHGSRYPAGSYFTLLMKRALDRADSLNTITPLGRQLLVEVDAVVASSEGRWGQLDSIGEAEHRGIAARLYRACPQLLDSARVVALSSSSPRSVMSMYSFTHQLSKMARHIDITAMSGERFSPLMRNFDLDEEYKAYRKDSSYLNTYGRFLAKNVTIDPLLRVLGENYPLDYDEAQNLAMAEYYVMAGMDAMGQESDPSAYFTLKRVPATVVGVQLSRISALFSQHPVVASGGDCRAAASRPCADSRQRGLGQTSCSSQIALRACGDNDAVAGTYARARLQLSDKLF